MAARAAFLHHFDRFCRIQEAAGTSDPLVDFLLEILHTLEERFPGLLDGPRIPSSART